MPKYTVEFNDRIARRIGNTANHEGVSPERVIQACVEILLFPDLGFEMSLTDEERKGLHVLMGVVGDNDAHAS